MEVITSRYNFRTREILYFQYFSDDFVHTMETMYRIVTSSVLLLLGLPSKFLLSTLRLMGSVGILIKFLPSILGRVGSADVAMAMAMAMALPSVGPRSNVLLSMLSLVGPVGLLSKFIFTVCFHRTVQQNVV